MKAVQKNVDCAGRPLTSQAEAVRYFIKQMDEDMIDLLLSDEFTYQDKPKKVFMTMLTRAFQVFKAEGNTTLKSTMDICTLSLIHI